MDCDENQGEEECCKAWDGSAAELDRRAGGWGSCVGCVGWGVGGGGGGPSCVCVSRGVLCALGGAGNWNHTFDPSPEPVWTSERCNMWKEFMT